MKQSKCFLILGFLAILGVAGCDKLQKAVVCDEWSAQEGTEMGASWGLCKNAKHYEFACAGNGVIYNCNCIVDGVSAKTTTTNTTYQGDRAYWTNSVNSACGWNLSPK